MRPVATEQGSMNPGVIAMSTVVFITGASSGVGQSAARETPSASPFSSSSLYLQGASQQTQHGRVSRGRISDHTGARIDEQIGRGHELSA
jgi:hypothetical protein